MNASPASPALAREATGAAAVAVVVAVVALVASLFWHQLGRWALLALLAVPLVRNAVILLRGRGAERVWALVGAALLAATVLVSLP
jgi:hypothetical protein